MIEVIKAPYLIPYLEINKYKTKSQKIVHKKIAIN